MSHVHRFTLSFQKVTEIQYKINNKRTEKYRFKAVVYVFYELQRNYSAASKILRNENYWNINSVSTEFTLSFKLSFVPLCL